MEKIPLENNQIINSLQDLSGWIILGIQEHKPNVLKILAKRIHSGYEEMGIFFMKQEKLIYNNT